jgi:uncharacterized protein YjiS (DUF1127 family)
MSTPFSSANSLRLNRRRPLFPRYQSSSWRGWAAPWNEWSRWIERSRQRAALRDLADDKHLLRDLGLTRQEALDEANRPFWE